MDRQFDTDGHGGMVGGAGGDEVIEGGVTGITGGVGEVHRDSEVREAAGHVVILENPTTQGETRTRGTIKDLSLDLGKVPGDKVGTLELGGDLHVGGKVQHSA